MSQVNSTFDPHSEDTIDIQEVARLIGKSVRTAYRRLEKGMIPSVNHADFGGRGLTFSRSVVMKRLEELHRYTPSKRQRYKRRKGIQPEPSL